MAKWVVKQNGRTIDRGFTSYQSAWNWANDYVKGLESHKIGSKVYTPEFSVEPDRKDSEAENRIWRECTTHTQVRI